MFGPDTVERVGELAAELGGRRVLLVTDPGLVKAGHAARVQESLLKAGLQVSLFDRAKENPTTKCVDECVAVATAEKADLFIGLGGAVPWIRPRVAISSSPTAAGCRTTGVGKARKPMLPLIAIPTTAGTGSECQSAALIADEHTHQKMACLDPKAAARIAILDPALTLSQPARVTACTGIDAIAHAVETAVTTKRNPLSQMFSREAFRLCVTSLPQVLQHPKDVEARGRMLLGAAYAGLAIENSMLGAAHSAANPLTAHYNIVHGQAVGMLLPLVVRFNAEHPEALRAYAELASGPELATVKGGLTTALEALIARLESLLNLAGFPRSLADCGVEPAKIKLLAEEAAKQWTANFNPRRIGPADFVGLYEAAFNRRSDGDLV